MNDSTESKDSTGNGPQTTRPVPRIARLVVIIVSVTIAREVIQLVIPKDTNLAWRMLGGATIAGLIGVLVWYVIFPPVWRYVSRGQNG